MATARPLFVSPRGRRRRPGRWLRPRGVIRGRPTFEYNRIYETGPRVPWLSAPAPTATPAHLVAGSPTVAAASGAIHEPARWWMRQRYRVIAVDSAVIVLALLLGVVPTLLGSSWATDLEADVRAVRGPEHPEATLWALAIAATWLVLMTASDLWGVPALRSGQATIRPLVRRAGALFLAVGVVAYFVGDPCFRPFLLLSIPAGAAGLVAARSVSARRIRALRASGALPGLVLLDGYRSDMGQRLTSWLPAYWGAATTVCIEGATTDPTGAACVDAMDRRIRTAGADLLVLADPEKYTPGQIADLAWTGLAVGTDVMVPAPSTGGRAVVPAPVAVRLVGGVTAGAGVPELGLITVDPRPPRSVRAARRIADVVLVGVAGIVLLPLVLVVAVVAAIVQGPPVFVENERVGRDGGVFGVWAFRCVAHTSGAARADRRGVGTDLTVPTPFGRAVRRWGLENIPGLLAVLTGDLALVGPRPVPPAVGARPGGPPWRRPGWTGRWRDPLAEDTGESDGEHLGRDLRVLTRLIGRRLRHHDPA